MEKIYLYPTVIEPTGKKTKNNCDEYVVNGQDGPLPSPQFWGNYEECLNWQEKNT